MFSDSFDRTIRQTLKQVANQRVRIVLQPGDHWVIENTGLKTKDTHAALLTCYMRGWLEPLEKALPTAQIPADFNLANLKITHIEQQYRLTSAGWSALYRTAEISRIALAISAISFVVVIGRAFLGK